MELSAAGWRYPCDKDKNQNQNILQWQSREEHELPVQGSSSSFPVVSSLVKGTQSLAKKQGTPPRVGEPTPFNPMGS